jgi:hypothetical protein
VMVVRTRVMLAAPPRTLLALDLVGAPWRQSRRSSKVICEAA